MNAFLGRCSAGSISIGLAAVVFCSCHAAAQDTPTCSAQTQASPKLSIDSPQGYNQQLQRLLREAAAPADASAEDYRIGAGDLLDISVFEAPDLNRTVRVSADGELTLPLVGDVHATGLSSREMESVLDELLRRSYMTDPHVSVFVREMESHAVSVLGAVENPGVYQIRSSEPLIEVLSMSHGLADDAGDTVIVMRHGASASSASADPPDPVSAAAPDAPASSARLNGKPQAVAVRAAPESVEIKLKDLLDSKDTSYNVMINPGDVVKVPRAGIVYVVGEVHKPGGFLLKTNENISVLQALALAEGITHTASGKRARIIRTNKITEARSEVPIDLNRILAGRAPDPLLRPKDILFVPNSAGRAALFRGTEAALSIVGGVIVYRR
ncbi:MAG TPA: polysaccharide biosynthesis/export family protein [Candidatus Acidoferrales bacterium]|nr:polysaccharide biosynthesis/export family protein [Candidatus Acidoferrales bacterium]